MYQSGLAGKERKKRLTWESHKERQAKERKRQNVERKKDFLEREKEEGEKTEWYTSIREREKKSDRREGEKERKNNRLAGWKEIPRSGIIQLAMI